jgi:hypothetical protein
VPFFREQNALFLREKCCCRPMVSFENLKLCYVWKIFLISVHKYDISAKIFGMSGKNLSFLGKNVISQEKFFSWGENFFGLPPPPPPPNF